MLFQAFVFSVACALAIWTALDFGFDGLAKGVALFGLSGRLIGSMGVLMALGGAIVMAWQARPTWRFSWQCASFIAGMLYLSSLRCGRHRSGSSRPLASPQRGLSGLLGHDDLTLQFRTEKSHIR